MSRKTWLFSLGLFGVICLERSVQFLNLLRFHNLGFTAEYVIGQFFAFLYTYLPVIVLIPALVFLAVNLKREKIAAFFPLGLTLITLWFFSNFSFFNTYSTGSFFARLPQYEEVVKLVKLKNLSLIESYDQPRSTYWEKYDYYGDILISEYKLPRKYQALVRDNMDQSKITILRSEKKGLIQIEFPINGIQFSYIYTESGELFKGESKYNTIEKKNEHWYYVIYQ